MSIGESLRQAREDKGVSLEDVENSTKIRRKYLKALEEENYDVLPGKVYVRGFLRNYARFLNLDGEALVDQYNEVFDITTMDQEIIQVEPKTTRRRSAPNRGRSYLVVAVLLAIGLFYLVGIYGDNMQQKITDKPGQNDGIVLDPDQQAPSEKDVGDEIADKNGSSEQGPNQEAQGMEVTLRVVDADCWMRIIVDNENVFEGTVNPGNIKTFKGKESVQLRLGDAGAVQVTVNGQNYGYLGAPGAIVDRAFALGEVLDESVGG